MEKKEFAVFGLGRFGRSVAHGLADAGCEVLVVDINEEQIQTIANSVTYAVCGDVTNKELIDSLGISNYDGVIVAMGDNLEASVMATILAKEVGVPLVLTKAQTELAGKVLKKVGSDKIIFPEKETGIRIANKLIHGNYFDAFELSETYSIMEVDCRPEWAGQTLKSLDFRAIHKLNVIGLRQGHTFSINPDPDLPLNENDVLVLIGRNDDLDKVCKKG